MPRMLLFAAVLLLAAGPARAQDLEAYRAGAMAAIQQLRSEMMTLLQETMKAEGPAGATGVCRHLAPQISERIEAETGWTIRRTALRARNPANAPREEEKGVLLSFLARNLAGQSPAQLETIRLIERDGEPTVHYMRAIPTMEPCLACHGEKLTPEVAAAIAENYPDDQATGFKVGDIRGAFSLYKPLKEAAAPAPKTGPEATVPAVPPAPADKSARIITFGPDDRKGDALAGETLYAENCAGCHDAGALSKNVFGTDPEDPRMDMCLFLQTHGLTDEARDCDIIAYLKAIALDRMSRKAE